MKKAVLLFIILLLPACTAKTPKHVFYAELRGTNWVALQEKNNGAYFYCFDKERKQLREEMQFWVDKCLELTFMQQPAEISMDQDNLNRISGEFTGCYIVSYINQNKDYFSMEGLSQEQQAKCYYLKRNIIEQLPDEYEPREKEDRKYEI